MSTLIDLIDAAIDAIERSVTSMQNQIQEPMLVDDGRFLRARIDNPRRKDACILKALCMASNLRASRLLIENKYFHEAGTLFRQLNEIGDDIFFLLEPDLDQTETTHQERYLQQFFSELFEDPGDVVGTAHAQERVKRSKIIAAGARTLENCGVSNLHSNQQYGMALFRFYSAYAHASYPTVMDVFFNSSDRQFGYLPPESLWDSWYEALATMTGHCVVCSAFLAYHLTLMDAFEELRDFEPRLREIRAR